MKRNRVMKKVGILLCAISVAFAGMAVSVNAQESASSVDVVADTHVGDLGQLVDAFTVALPEGFDTTGIDTDNIHIERNVRHPSLPEYADGVISVAIQNGLMRIVVDPFLFKQGFTVSCIKESEILFSFTMDNVSHYNTAVVDEFDTVTTDEAIYRIFKPETDEKLPLIIWFHGAGERGTDGEKPLTDYRAASCWAEPAYQAKHPCVVLVPQIDPEATWDKTKLDDVRKMADKLIADGDVDEKRVYSLGLSAWQSTLWFDTYNLDLVAASMTSIYWHAYDPDPKTGDEFSGVNWKEIADAELPLWSCITYSDPTGATEEMLTYLVPYQEENNPNFHYSIWDPDVTNSYRLVGFQLHQGFVPAVNDQEIIDWLFAQCKE